MDVIRELKNVWVIRVSTRAALLSAPEQAEGHRRQAGHLLDEAEQRTDSPIVRAEIDSVRQELSDGAGPTEPS